MRIYLYVLFIVIAAGGYILWIQGQDTIFQTAPVARGPAVEAIYATAVVEPEQWAEIAPVKTGRFLEILVQEGDDVQKGQLLARLDDQDLNAQLDEAKAAQTYHEKDLARVEKLIRTGSVSEDALDERTMQVRRYKAQVRTLEEQINQLALKAPQDGTVLWRDVEPGEVKEAGKPVFWVGKPRPLRLEAEVDEEDIPKVMSPQKVLITADAFPGQVLEGKVSHISPKGDPVNKSYRVYMSLPDDTKLMIGMTVETNTIIQQKDDALLAPVEALTNGMAMWVAREENGRTIARKISVQTGVIGKEHVEILSGLREGERVILPPFNTLSDGAKIRLKD